MWLLKSTRSSCRLAQPAGSGKDCYWMVADRLYCSQAQFWHLQHFKWPKKFQTQQTFIYSIRKKKALQLTVDNQSRQSKLESLQWRMFQVASCWQPRMLQKATNSECKINDQDLGQCSLMVFTGKHKHRVLPSRQQLLHLKFGKVYNG